MIAETDLALVYGYPSNLLYKVLERRARACIALGIYYIEAKDVNVKKKI